MTDSFTIRLAAPEDAEVIVTHRRRMFEDMGLLDADHHERGSAAFRLWLQERLADGRYLGWFAVIETGEVAAGAGLWLMDWPPGYYDASPYRGYILNVYTEPRFRRNGLAKRLVQMITDWCWDNDIPVVSLHASDQGRPIYESLGYFPTNEMRIVKPG